MKKALQVFVIITALVLINTTFSRENVNTINSRGWKAVKAGNYNRALTLFLRAVKLKPDYAWSYRNAGWVLNNKLNKPLESVKYFISAIRLSPESTTPVVELALAYNKAKKYALSVKYFVKTLNLYKSLNKKPSGSWIYSFLTSILLNKLNKSNLAVKYALEGIRYFNKDAGYHFHVGNIYKKLKRYKIAMQFYYKSLALYKAKNEKPNTWLLVYASSVLSKKLNQFNKAVLLMKSFISKYPDDALAHAHLGGIYLNKKKYLNAIRYYDKSMVLYNKQNKKIPWHVLTNTCAIYMFFLKPHKAHKAIPYLNYVLNHNYKKKTKDFAVDWLAHAYLVSRKFKPFLKHVTRYLKTDISQKTRKKLYKKISRYYYKHGVNLRKALYYARKLGNDYILVKKLTAKKVYITRTFHLKKLMRKYVKWFKPGIMNLNLPINTEYHTLLSVRSDRRYLKKIFKIGSRNYAQFDFSRGFPEILKLTIIIKHKTFGQMPEKFYTANSTEKKLRHFATLKTKFYDIDNPVLINAVKRITKNSRTLKEKIIAVFNWVSKNVKHWSVVCRENNIEDTPDNWPKFKKISGIYKRRAGICNHISYLFIGMMRILKVPARAIGGSLFSYKKGKTDMAGHVVAEIYDKENRRWMYVEPQGFVPFGVSSSTHVIYDRDSVTKIKLKRKMSIGWLDHLEYWKLGNKKHHVFRIEYLR